jgi:hypothetical protein
MIIKNFLNKIRPEHLPSQKLIAFCGINIKKALDDSFTMKLVNMHILPIEMLN